MKKLYTFILAIYIATCSCFAQAIWDKSHLDEVRSQLERPMYSAAYNALIADADKLLDATPLSVMDKKRPSPSGDNHDYTRLARYFHPDPNGGPYIQRDGITNPEIALYDRVNLGTTANRVANLGHAWYLSGDQRYASKATELLRVTRQVAKSTYPLSTLIITSLRQ